MVIDVDSTLCAIEGVDWLARRRSASLASEVAGFSERAMNGEVELDAVYGLRLSLVKPTRKEVSELGEEYARQLAPGAVDAIAKMKRAGIDVHLVSGGLLPAVRAAASAAGVFDKNVHAVEVHFQTNGDYDSFDSSSPLTKEKGKRDLVASLGLERPALIVGDGNTDAEARPVVDAYAAFTGFIRRETAVAAADYVVTTFAEVLDLAIK